MCVCAQQVRKRAAHRAVNPDAEHTMPDDATDAAEGNGIDGNGGVGDGATFSAVWWEPAKQEYGILNLLMCRTAMEEELAKPTDVEHLRVIESRLCSFSVPPPRREVISDEDDEGVSEGEPYEATEPVSWQGRTGSWWRVQPSLGEDVIVREGVSLTSPELRRVCPGEVLQQAGHARALAGGRAKGCVRLPVRPSGWVTADATKAGGPKYIVRASVPRWRVVHKEKDEDEIAKAGDVIVREESDLASREVDRLVCGDIVEQAGPSLTLFDGIIRMPVTTSVIRRNELGDNGDSTPPAPANSRGPQAKTLGWVTIDASTAGGPVFFKAVTDADSAKRRRRRPQQQWPS